MKIRTGFVSNSSSSSFIIALPGMPESAVQLHAWLYPEGPISIQPYDDAMPSEAVAQRVFHDIQDTDTHIVNPSPLELQFGVNPLSRLFNSSGLMAEGRPSDRHLWRLPYGSEEESRATAEHEEKMTRFAEKLAETFYRDNKGSSFFKVDYADDGGEAVLEHGDIFRNVPHVRISNH
jgi:hypothetical protein